MWDTRKIRALLLALLAGWTIGAHAQVEVETQDGLGLVLDANGRVVALRVDGRELPLLGGPGGFFVEDLMGSVPRTYFAGSAEVGNEGVIFRGSAPGLSLELEAPISAQADEPRLGR